MAVIFTEGFDKYGGVNSNVASVAAMLVAGEWTTANTAFLTVVAPLSATGQALQIFYNVGTPLLSKTLSASYARLIGGIRFNVSALSVTSNCGVTFTDAGTNQCCITINGVTGLISLRNGTISGTALATSSGAVSVGATNYLEWDITFGNSAAYQVWLNGVSLFSSTGDTTTTANNTANGFTFTGAGSGSTITFDDLYLFDTTGTTNNAVLLTSPRIETTFPVSDSAQQFVVGAGILGSSTSRIGTNQSLTLGRLWLRRFIPTSNCTLNSISILPQASSGAINYRPVVYADSAGAAGTLMSTGSTVTGATASVVVTLPLTTPQSLTAGTQYWLGLMNDTAVNHFILDTNNSAYVATVTFASGAPGTAPAMTSGQFTWLLWGNLTGMAANYDEVNNQPPDGQYSYVYDSTVNHEDLYNFNAFSQPPVTIHTVAVKAYAQKSDSGTKTVSMRLKSGAVDSGGSLTNQALGTTFGWLGSFFPTDPNTSAAWVAANLNAATSGFKIDS